MEEPLAALFLIALLVASGSFFGMRVARAHRGEPWVATERFKNNLSLIGPYGVDAAAGDVSPFSAPATRRARRRSASDSRTGGRHKRPSSALSTESLQFALALLVAASAFTFVCALFGMLAWEFCLGTLAGTGLFVAFLLESRESRRRVTPKVAYMREWREVPGAEQDIEDHRLYAGSFG
jgi:Flp pilus assembly protein TadB